MSDSDVRAGATGDTPLRRDAATAADPPRAWPMPTPELSAPARAALLDLLAAREDWLMGRVLAYARAGGYTRYTSTQLEAWRLSIHGMTQAAVQASGLASLEFSPDQDLSADPVAAFGITEARKHHDRGVTAVMFLGLFKYYRQSYLDLVAEQFEPAAERSAAAYFIARIFDRVELAFLDAWPEMRADPTLTALQGATREAVNQKNDFLAIVETMADSVIVFDQGGGVRFANRAASTLFGLRPPPPGLPGQPGDARASGTPMPPLTQILALSDTTELLQVVQANGPPADFSVRATPVVDASDGRSGYVVILSDQSYLVRQNQRLAEANHKIGNQYARLERTLHELDAAQKQLVQSEKMSSIGQLAAGVAHEINNPMGFIGSNIRALEKYAADLFALIAAYEAVPAAGEAGVAARALRQRIDYDYLLTDVPELIRESLDGCERVRRIVADLKGFARPADDQIADVAVEACIDSAINICWNQIKYKAELQRDFAAVGVIRGNAAQLGQVLVNLLVNAAHAIQAMGRITVRTRREGDDVVISVADTGCGIPAEALAKIFDPFYTTKPVGEGTGLGLYISLQIVQRHGGRIEVNSSADAGTCFEVWLPAAAPLDGAAPATA